MYLRVRVTSVRKKERIEKKQKRGIDFQAKRSQKKESTENIIHHQFYQHLATNLEKNSHESYKDCPIRNFVPHNINQVKTLDNFVKDILKEKRKQKNLDFEIMLEKI